MSKTGTNTKASNRLNFMDALLYLLTGSAMLFISVSFLLWLRF